MTDTAENTIDDALARFLREQQARLSPRTFANYASIVDLLRDSLNGYGYQWLGEADLTRWQHAVNSGSEDAFTQLFGPDKIADNLGEFLGYFMVHKVIAGQELLRAAGTVTKKLMRWLAAEGLIDQADAADAAERAGDAARELPRAQRLADQLFELTRAAPDVDPDTIADGDWVEDQVIIERVERGKLWFDGGRGPLRVPVTASDLAEPGWMVWVVMARIQNKWQLLQNGNVYT